MKVALYCPMNDPDDGGTSGDRRMARQIRAVLVSLGHVVQTITAPRTHTHIPDGAGLDGLKDAVVTARDRLAQAWALSDSTPDIWLTYHNYHKAPDLLGPRVSAGLGIPYAIFEASHTASKMQGPWARRSAAAREATQYADVHFCFTRQDRQGLLEVVSDPERLVDLPPFIDTAPFSGFLPQPSMAPNSRIRLVSVAMMRNGPKANSYAALARSLALLPELDWEISLAGDGPARAEVTAMFQQFERDRADFLGLVPHDEMPGLMAGHDLFVWPGLREPFGLVFLEAQAAGLPVVAFRSGGVPDTVRDGETALLVAEGDLEAFANAISCLAADGSRRRMMAVAAQRFVLGERGLESAAMVISKGLELAVHLHASRILAGA